MRVAARRAMDRRGHRVYLAQVIERRTVIWSSYPSGFDTAKEARDEAADAKDDIERDDKATGQKLRYR